MSATLKNIVAHNLNAEEMWKQYVWSEYNGNMTF